ncbi:hypothetical protein [Silvimonas soli]|uniref:hypothetical protein n=1 Tax=Silvimonas soli TaxID=2980100 RepID=UPI0024B3B934|nr:hypothetical protein [Silvimonas soli]
MRSIRQMAIAMALLAPLAVTSHAAGLGFMSDTPLARLKPDEITSLNKTIQDALANSKIGEKENWSNVDQPSSTPTSVEITPTRDFERDGMSCRALILAFKSKIQNDTMTPSYCKAADGTWQLAPPNSAKKPKNASATTTR